ncbi:hypothetical protein R1flu_020534 [Riccia fluitans]|uniref:Uncharacterized protein n=1 Tax=Riccia fluitans TaxID=41844 RepID=A0ABD1ZNE8_9MARC
MERSKDELGWIATSELIVNSTHESEKQGAENHYKRQEKLHTGGSLSSGFHLALVQSPEGSFPHVPFLTFPPWKFGSFQKAIVQLSPPLANSALPLAHSTSIRRFLHTEDSGSRRGNWRPDPRSRPIATVSSIRPRGLPFCRPRPCAHNIEINTEVRTSETQNFRSHRPTPGSHRKLSSCWMLVTLFRETLTCRLRGRSCVLAF